MSTKTSLRQAGATRLALSRDSLELYQATALHRYALNAYRTLRESRSRDMDSIVATSLKFKLANNIATHE
eukprot:2822503-Amphidinium_carterae.1